MVVTRERYSKILILYLQLAAHFLIGFNKSVLVVQHDAIDVCLDWAQSKGHLHLLFLTITSQGYQCCNFKPAVWCFSLPLLPVRVITQTLPMLL